ncbi:capsid protein VP1 [avian chapparvovirus BR_DF10]|uniref:Capsid protein VP1 n=1 Tax=avian chapparvovirus BR_DF10 TaxID=3070175 RepID=A0A5C0PWL4_9VIRU|nr:capsid protein VP1 [Avian chapparvovirus]QEJ80804.1 capsid protein VP1 [avian chapparvovirus BR_DF10]
MFLINRLGKDILHTSTATMADNVSISNVYSVYLKNQPYIYPSDQTPDQYTNIKINTGWNIIPNMLWKHFVTPRQWAELIINNEAYHVNSVSCTIFNMIPMTTQIAIQNTSVFTAFNNTVYAWGYTDELYETSWEGWDNVEDSIDQRFIYCPNLAWKEGLNYTVSSNDRNKLNTWPVYLWRVPHVHVSSRQTWGNVATAGAGDGVFSCGNNGNCWPSGVFWDPLNMPDKLMELRPGKNAMHFTWNTHDCDSHLWFNFDQIAAWWPWTSTGPYSVNTRPGQIKLSSDCDPELIATYGQGSLTSSTLNSATATPCNDYTVPNLAYQPIVPCAWWWKEMQNSIIQDRSTNKADMWFAGTEFEQAKYPPHQWFTKIVPLYDSNGTWIEVTAQCSVKVTINIDVKKRRSAIYAPTWGPFSWRNVYSAQTACLNFQPAMVRYRTGGARRTWQNIAQTDGQNWWQTGHPREDPYVASSTVASGSGIASTALTMTTTTAPTNIDPTAKAKTNTTFTRPVAPKRRVQTEKPPSPNLPINDLTFFPHLSDTQL